MHEYPRMQQPSRPRHIPEYAELCLDALANQGLGDRLSLGGAFGLLHCLDYRLTHDVDAWWVSSVTPQERDRVLQAITDALQPFGQVRRRVWGDVASVELERGGKTVFAFQIERRDAQLQPSTPSAWSDVLLDSFPDLVASKMVALLERGAPRDFRDICNLCQARLSDPPQCWQWWKERQHLAGSDIDIDRASLAVQTHLARIAQHRPLTEIPDGEQRTAAASVRAWFTAEFLNALVD